MTIKMQRGFTLIELMVTIAIIGILGVTAIPVYNTWLQRAYGSEAAIMVKQIMDAEINYYLENDKFYPDMDTIIIYNDDDPDSANIMDVYSNLHISVPTGHFLDYIFYTYLDTDGKEIFQLTISSSTGFDLFKDKPVITYIIDESGNISDLLEL